MKPPAFPLYVRDILCSKTIRQLHARRDMRGLAYLYLLCEAWLEEPPGTLPNDHEQLAVMARLPDNEFAEFWPMVQDQFEVGEDGRLFHPRLLRCWVEQQSRKLRGRKGGEASGQARHEARHQAELKARYQAERERVADADADADDRVQGSGEGVGEIVGEEVEE